MVDGAVRKGVRRKTGAVRKKAAPVARRKVTQKPAEKVQVVPRVLVRPDPADEKSGCLYCSLLAFSTDFDKHAAGYQRNAEKIIARAKEPHEIKSRCTEEKWEPVDILFVGEAPGGNEDKEGLPFVGRSGQLLRDAIDELIDTKKVGFTNLVRCRPPRNRNPNKTEIKSCSHRLVREIKARKPKLIVALGNLSMSFVAGQTGITTMTGNVMRSTHPAYSGKVLACLHPAYVLRANNDYELARFCAALEKANQIVVGKYKDLPGPGTYKVLTKIEDVERLMKRFRRERRPLAIDTETGGLTPFQREHPRMLCWGFSNKVGEGFSIPFDHADSPWRVGGPKSRERPRLIAALRGVWCDAKLPKRAQNLKFDYQHGWAALGMEPRGFGRDTMLMHWTIDERRGTHGLKTMAYTYTGMGGYEKPLEDYIEEHAEADVNKGGSYAAVPGRILFPYVGMDADVTIRCDAGLAKEEDYQNGPQFRALAEDFFPRLTETLSRMEYAGAQIDTARATELEIYYRKEIERCDKAIRALPRIRKFVANKRRAGRTGKKKSDVFEFNPGSAQQLQEVMFGYYKMKPVELTDAGFDLLVARHTRLNGEAKQAGKRRLQFGDVVQDAIREKDWSVFSTKADVLHEFERQGNELAPLLIEFRGVKTLYDNFVRRLNDRLDDADRVHGSFLIHGTATGRLASRDPNLQNIPNKGGGLVKQAYISRFGAEGVLLQLDYSQIELRITACFYDDPVMIRTYVNGEDLHMLTTLDISGMTSDEYYKLGSFAQKEWRVRGKRVNFLTVYGGGALGLMTVLRKEGVFITIEEGAEMIERFYAKRPILKRNIERHSDEVRRNGYCDTFTGRRRRVPEVFSDDEEIVARALRQTINAPIQGGAADMTLMALVLIDMELRARGFKSFPTLTVHDSIMLDCVVDEVFEVATICKAIMESLPQRTDAILPGIDWSWLRVPIKADCEMGTDWGRMIGFDPEEVAADVIPAQALLGADGKPVRDPSTVDEIWTVMDYKLQQTAA